MAIDPAALAKEAGAAYTALKKDDGYVRSGGFIGLFVEITESVRNRSFDNAPDRND